jgi:diguanylate cyclase (GGDEF)-like protein
MRKSFRTVAVQSKRAARFLVGSLLKSFGTRILLLVVISVLGPSFMIGFVIIYDTKQFQTGQTEQTFTTVLQSAKREVSYWNRDRKNELEMLVHSNGFLNPLDRYFGETNLPHDPTSTEMKRFFEIVIEKLPLYEQFVVMSTSGRNVLSSSAVTPETSALLQSLLKQSMNEFHRSVPYGDEVTRRLHQWLLIPVATPGGSNVTVCVKTSLDDLTGLLSETVFPDVDDLYIVDEEGRLLSRPRLARPEESRTRGFASDDFETIITQSSTAPSGIQPITGVAHASQDRRKTRYLASAIQEQLTSWWIVCEAAESRVFGPVAAWKNRVILVVGVISLLFLLVAWRLSRNVLAPLSQLTLGTKRINQGLVGVAIPVTRMDEVGEMITAFNEMAQRIAFNEARLKSNNVELKRTNDELTVANDKLGELSVTDGLTGLFNHRHFWDLMDQEIKRSARTGKQLALVIADVDNFKDVNDRFGHAAGDRLIRSIAEVVKTTIRATDLAARYGGEEFAILLPETDRRGAMEVSEKLRRAVEEAVFEVLESDEVISTTVSTGVSLYRGDRHEFFNAADEALYISKSAGKNRVTFARSSEALIRQPAD